MSPGRFARLVDSIKVPSDPPEEQIAKVTLAITVAVAGVLGAIWGAGYWALGRPAAAMIPGSYSLISFASLGLFLITRRYRLFRFSQLLLMLFLPFFLQWTLGGFANSGAVGAMAFLAVMGALVFQGPRAAVGCFLAFGGLMAVSAVFDRQLSERTVPLPPQVLGLFFPANLLGLCGVLLVVVRYVVTRQQLLSNMLAKEQKETTKALAAANVNSARLISEIEEKNRIIEEAHQRLANSFDEVKKQHALQEIEKKRMEAELATARAVQAMLIPEAPRGVRGVDLAISYRSASECGGDWLGFFDDPSSGKISILIGDVTGHGVGSALVTAGVFGYFSTLRTLRTQHSSTHAASTLANGELYDPSAILTHLDEVVGEMGKSRTFMTLFASVLDYREKRVRFSNAGHCFPFVISRERWEAARTDRGVRFASLVTPPGRILGYQSAGQKKSFPSGDLSLSKDDLLLWYTDGLLENRHVSGEPLGSRRLLGWVLELWDKPIDQIKSGLDARVDEYLKGRPLDDDIAYILARVK